LALQNFIKGDENETKKVEKLAIKRLDKFKNESGEKKSGVYVICVPLFEAPTSFEGFLLGQKYVGKDTYSGKNTNRLVGHHSNAETVS
jgi:hypothetical protein